MMSGTPNSNIETRYLNYLHTVDPALYNVAMRIGSEVRSYGYMEDLHQQGVLSDSQNQYDMSLLGMLFGKDADSMRMILNGGFTVSHFAQIKTIIQDSPHCRIAPCMMLPFHFPLRMTHLWPPGPT